MTRDPAASLINVPLENSAETAALAARVAALVRRGDVIALAGPLGSGKTTFVRALIGALKGAEEEVPSPTFTLVQTYELPSFAVWHFDLYRIDRAEDADELGLDEALADGVVVLEWPERLAGRLPADRLTVTLAFGPTPEARRATLHGGPSWHERLGSLNR